MLVQSRQNLLLGGIHAAWLKDLTETISVDPTDLTSSSESVTTASVSPDAFTNSTSIPSGSYTSTTVPKSPACNLCPGKSCIREQYNQAICISFTLLLKILLEISSLIFWHYQYFEVF